MTQWIIYAISGVSMFVIGLSGVFNSSSLVRQVFALNITGSGLFLVLVAFARRAPGTPDPLPHALVLTGIVVSVSATALALAMARRAVETRASANALPQATNTGSDKADA